jgi:hypothetical protein
MSAEQLQARYAQVAAWFAENRLRISATRQLQGPATATPVRFGIEGPPVVTDGPFLEGKEAIGGFAEVDVADLLADSLDGYYLYHATRAQLLRELGRGGEARRADERAFGQTANPAERALLAQRLS